jgi:hypothetical protein
MTNSSGESALTSSSSRPERVFSSSRWRSRQRRCRPFRAQHVLQDRHEIVVPALQGARVLLAHAREGLLGAREIRPPLQRAAVLEQHRHVELGLDVAGAVLLEVEIAVPRHVGDRALEEGVRVVEHAGMARILLGAEAAARHRQAVDRQCL